MSLVIGCDTGSLGLDDIFRLISGIDVDGNRYIRICDDETPATDLSNLDCINTATMLDILRGALFLNDDGEYCINVSAVSPFCTQYLAAYNSFATPPSIDIAIEQNKMVCGLVNDGVWTKLDLFYLYAQTNGIDALINLVNPGTYDATAVHSPAFTALEGFTGDGANDYIDCNWNPNTNGVNFTRNNASMGGYIRNDVNEDARIFGCSDVANSFATLAARKTGVSIMTFNADDGGWEAAAVADSLGMFICNRTASNVHDLYKNKVQIINDTEASWGVPNVNMYNLATNFRGTAVQEGTNQLSMYFAGGGLTESDVDSITDRFQTYMISNGKEV